MEGHINTVPAIRLPKTFTPTAVMANPESLLNKVEVYFNERRGAAPDGSDIPPTPPGLAMAMGLRGFDALLRILQEEENNPGTYPEASMDVLVKARSYIEEYYIENGLREKLPHAFIKFLMSAFFGRNEKTITESQGNAQTQISILGVSPDAPMPIFDVPEDLPEIEATNAPCQEDDVYDVPEFRITNPDDDDVENL